MRRVVRVNDRQAPRRIFWRLRTAARRANIPSRYGPDPACVNRFNRRRPRILVADHGPQQRVVTRLIDSRPRVVRNAPALPQKGQRMDRIERADQLLSDPAARARALGPTIAAAADEIENTRRLPPRLLAALHEARLFRLLLPRSAGGDEVTCHRCAHDAQPYERDPCHCCLRCSRPCGDPVRARRGQSQTSSRRQPPPRRATGERLSLSAGAR